MGNRSTKSNLRNAIIFLNISADSVSLSDDKFWAQIWTEDMATAVEIIKGISNQEIRMLRDGSPKNFASLTYKMIERLCLATGTLCNTQCQQTAVLNATRMLIRILPCIFEDSTWRKFFTDNHIHLVDEGKCKEPDLVFPKKSDYQRDYKSYLPQGIGRTSPPIALAQEKIAINDNNDNNEINLFNDFCDSDAEMNLDSKNSSNPNTLMKDKSTSSSRTLMESLVLSVCDLLFCPEFTVTPHTENHLYSTVDAPPEDLKSLSTCDYVWEPGVGFDSNTNSTTYYDKSRIELMRLLLACLSTTLYETPESSLKNRNQWMEIFASNINRHALPLFTSFLNVVFIYNPSKKLLPFNNLLFEDNREELVELAIQILIVTLDFQFKDELPSKSRGNPSDKSNLFIEYMSRIHRSEDFVFLINGFKRLLNNRLEQGYLINSSNRVNFDQELLILFWKICNLNSKFVAHLLKTKDVLDITVPILYHLNENFQDPTKSALIHIGIFNLLILSGERNFGVRLNEPYLTNVLVNVPAFTGSYADLLIIVFHKLILYGQNLHQLFDFLLTIVVNISPYLKALTMISSKCLLQLFEIFSSPFVIFTEPNYHQLVVFLLEIFNNLIQYQFDGNTNLVYFMITRKEAFYNLANLPSSTEGIHKVFNKLIKKKQRYEFMERQCIEESGENQNNEANDKSENFNQQIDHAKKRIGATVSSNNIPTSPNMLKQEVALIATPDICNVTQAIHPFDMDNNNTINNSQIFFGSSEKNENPLFDDILNQTTNIELSAKASTSHTESTIVESTSGPKSLIGSDSLTLETTENQTTEAKTSESCDLDPKKWKPTSEWVKQWKQSLPLHTTLRMIKVLSLQLERFKKDHMDQVEETEMMKFLQSSTLVGLLPVPHPILIRKYHTNCETTLWFRACTWGIIYVRNTIWTNTDIRLMKLVGC